MTTEQIIEEAVGDYLTARREEHVPTSRWYASGALGCWRQRWWVAERKEPDRQPGNKALLVMDIGSTVHRIIQDALGRLPGVQAEVPWRVDTYGGRADLVVPSDVLGVPGPLVVEIKTMAAFGFKRTGKAGVPEPRHALPAALCSYALEIPHFGVLEVNRDSMEMRFTPYELSREWVKECEEEIEEALRLDALGKVPHRIIPGEPEVKDPLGSSAPWQCRYCQFVSACSTEGP